MSKIDSVPSSSVGAIAAAGTATPGGADPARRRFQFSRALGYDVASGIVAVVLLIAATLKGRSLFSQEVVGWGFGVKRLGGIGLVAGEWIVGAWLLSGLARDWSRRAVLLLLMAFAIVAGWRLVRGDADCGCFGDVSVHPRWTVAFDLSMLGALFWLGRATRRRRERHAARPQPAGLTIRAFVAGAYSVSVPAATLLAMASAATVASRPSRSVLLDPGSWVGTRCPLLAFIDGAVPSALMGESATLLLIDRRCQKCLTEIRRLRDHSEGTVFVVAIAGIDANAAAEPFGAPFQEIALRRDVRYVAEVPAKLCLNRGVVVRVERP